MEIKEAVETNDKSNEVIDTTHVKLEQTCTDYGVQCDSIKSQQVKENKVKEEDACKTEIKYLIDSNSTQNVLSTSETCDSELYRTDVKTILTTDGIDNIKMEEQLAVIKSETLEEDSYRDSAKVEDMDTVDSVDHNEQLQTKYTLVLDRSANENNWGTEVKVEHMEAEKLFFCYNCNYTACSKMRLVQHISAGECNPITNLDKSQIARPLNVYVCLHCNKVFKKKTALDKHVNKKHAESIASLSSEILECTDCDYKATDGIDFRKHKLIHTAAASKLISCPYCNTSLKSRQILDNHIVRRHPDFVESVKRKIHECSQCTYKTVFKPSFKRHLLMHSDAGSSNEQQDVDMEPNGELFVCYNCNYSALSKVDLTLHISIGACYSKISLDESRFTNTEQQSLDTYSCTQCSMVFKKKTSLDDHCIKKHTDSITSISSKIHKCTYCSYKTTKKTNITRHMVIHPTAVATLIKCKYCDASFNSGEILDNHVLKKHPAFQTSIERTIFKCSYCPYKTIIKHYYKEHMRVHFRGEQSVCQHCNATFKSKRWLDAHIVKEHPEFIASVTTKIHTCSYCSYKTIHKCHFDAHMLIHSQGKPPTCKHCASTFKSKQLLDNHILKKHPDFSGSVSSKVHACSNCDYKSTKKSNFDRHVLKHLDSSSQNLISCQHCKVKFEGRQSLNKHLMEKHPNHATSVKITPCKHCTMTFNSKYDLDDHIVKKHQKFIRSVTRKIFECSYCSYKTVRTSKSEKHILSHQRQLGLNETLIKKEQTSISP